MWSQHMMEVGLVQREHTQFLVEDVVGPGVVAAGSVLAVGNVLDDPGLVADGMAVVAVGVLWLWGVGLLQNVWLVLMWLVV